MDPSEALRTADLIIANDPSAQAKIEENAQKAAAARLAELELTKVLPQTTKVEVAKINQAGQTERTGMTLAQRNEANIRDGSIKLQMSADDYQKALDVANIAAKSREGIAKLAKASAERVAAIKAASPSSSGAK